MTATDSPYVTVHGLKFAASLEAFTDCLFRPYEGGTCDGYIDRVLKGGIRLFFRGETYVLNPHHVFCLQTVMPNGRKWFSYGGELNRLSGRKLSDVEDAIRNLATLR